MAEKKQTVPPIPLDDLDWIQLRHKAGTYIEDDDYMPESFVKKSKRKIKENPFVPIGAGATLAALSFGLWSFLKGDSKTQQTFMRSRVGFQITTLAAMVLGFVFTTPRLMNKD